MPSVTVNGSNHQSLGLTFSSTANASLAAQIAQQINAKASTASTVVDPTRTPPAVAAGKTGEIFVTKDTNTPILQNSGYKFVAVNAGAEGGSAFIVDRNTASGQAILVDEKTYLNFTASAGSGTVVAGGYGSFLNVSGNGNWLLATGGGYSEIMANAANVSVLASGDDVIFAGAGNVSINATGAEDTLVFGGSGNLTFIGGTGGATILGGAGSETFYGSLYGTNTAESELIYGGAAGNNWLSAGDGAATLVGGGSGDQLWAFGDVGQLLQAGVGNETLVASAGGVDTLVAGSGGGDLLIGGDASDIFQFIKGEAGGSDTIAGFDDSSTINVNLQGYDTVRTYGSEGGNVTLTLSDNTKITFQDVTTTTGIHFV